MEVSCLSQDMSRLRRISERVDERIPESREMAEGMLEHIFFVDIKPRGVQSGKESSGETSLEQRMMKVSPGSLLRF